MPALMPGYNARAMPAPADSTGRPAQQPQARDGIRSSLTYAAAGVDYEPVDALKRLAQSAARQTAPELARLGFADVAASRGEPAYVVDCGDFYLATVLEDLGTKNLVADAMRSLAGRTFYDHLAQDTVAMIVNDLACVGAQPVVVSAYFAAGDAAWFTDEERAADLARGWAHACRLAGATWGGGESPALPGVICTGTAELAGAAVGIIRPKSRLVLGDRLAPGDVIVLIRSAGIHANGLTLARAIAEGLPDGYASPLPDGRRLGEALLDPTPIYAGAVEGLFEAGVDVHYLAAITGHGWRKLMRAAPELTYVVDTLPPVPPVLHFLQESGGVPDAEAYATWNMGAGLAIFCPAGGAPAALAAAARSGFDALIAGDVEAGPRRVLIGPLGLEYGADSLRVREER